VTLKLWIGAPTYANDTVTAGAPGSGGVGALGGNPGSGATGSGQPGQPGVNGLLGAKGSKTAPNIYSQSTPVKVVALKTTTLPAGHKGQAYAATLIAVDGKAPYTFSVSAGSLPPGIKLAKSTGVLSGKPTAKGTFTFAITVTDSATTKTSDSRQFTLTVKT
jgi:hypothetical protein